jgi:hypothetical protein
MTIRNVWVINKAWYADGKYCGNVLLAVCNNKTSAKKYLKQFLAAQYCNDFDESDQEDYIKYSFHDICNPNQYVVIHVFAAKEELFDGKKDSEYVFYKTCIDNSLKQSNEMSSKESVEYDKFIEDDPEDNPPQEKVNELADYIVEGIAAPKYPKNWLAEKWSNLKETLIDYYALDINRHR